MSFPSLITATSTQILASPQKEKPAPTPAFSKQQSRPVTTLGEYTIPAVMKCRGIIPLRTYQFPHHLNPDYRYLLLQ